MSKVAEICQERAAKTFTLQEVNDLVPLLTKISQKHENIISESMNTQRFMLKSGAKQERITEQDNIVGENMRQWGVKVYKLGAKVMPGGYLGFNSGCFYWSWHYGEKDCSYYHEYEDNPQIEECRRKLEANSKEY